MADVTASDAINVCILLFVLFSCSGLNNDFSLIITFTMRIDNFTMFALTNLTLSQYLLSVRWCH